MTQKLGKSPATATPDVATTISLWAVLEVMTGGEMCDTVKNYLDRRPVVNHRRVKCCNSSRSLYCPECCALLVEPDNRPPPISLPCKVDLSLMKRTGQSPLAYMPSV